MCSHGTCVSAHCEKCRPKWMKCPICGEKTAIMIKQCQSCNTILTKEARDAACELWRQKRAEKTRVQKEKLSLSAEKDACVFDHT